VLRDSTAIINRVKCECLLVRPWQTYPDGTFRVKYDEGGEEDHLPGARLRLPLALQQASGVARFLLCFY
jgi:hypothetical protein